MGASGGWESADDLNPSWSRLSITGVGMYLQRTKAFKDETTERTRALEVAAASWRSSCFRLLLWFVIHFSFLAFFSSLACAGQQFLCKEINSGHVPLIYIVTWSYQGSQASSVALQLLIWLHISCLMFVKRIGLDHLEKVFHVRSSSCDSLSALWTQQRI